MKMWAYTYFLIMDMNQGCWEKASQLFLANGSQVTPSIEQFAHTLPDNGLWTKFKKNNNLGPASGNAHNLCVSGFCIRE
jgi:hypothetical protein